jgi:hypothetical protein
MLKRILNYFTQRQKKHDIDLSDSYSQSTLFQESSCTYAHISRDSLRLSRTSRGFSDKDIIATTKDLRISPNSFPIYYESAISNLRVDQSQYEDPFATASDCYSCKNYSHSPYLKCAVNPTRKMDDDCNKFERALNFVRSDWARSEDNPANYPDWKNSENNPANYSEY